jgi:hypothetical protein
MSKREEFHAKQEELIKKVHVDVFDRTVLSCLAIGAVIELLGKKDPWGIRDRDVDKLESRRIKLLLEKTLMGLKEIPNA